MLDLILGLGGLLLMALVWLRRALRAQAPEAATAARYRANQRAVFRQRQAEIADDERAGLISGDEAERLRGDLQRQLLGEGMEAAEAGDSVAAARLGWMPVLLLSVVFVAAALWLYRDGSGYNDMQLKRLQREYAHAPSPVTLHKMIELAERDAQGPRNGQRMALLAQLYSEAGQHREAAGAWGKVAQIWSQDAFVLAQWAQSLYLAAGSRITPQARHLLEQSIEIDPQQAVSRGLLGIDAFSRQDYREAIDHWVPLLRSLPPGSPRAGIIAEGLQRAKGEAIKNGKLSGLLVEVDVADALQSGGNTTLMVYALAKGGSRMPLAVLRQPLQGTSSAVFLTEADAMTAGPGLYGPEQIKVVARLSGSGGARREAGDRQVESDWFDPRQNNKPLRLSIQ